MSLSLTCFAQPNNNAILWKISDNGMKEPSYLFGTIHAVPKKQFIISDSIVKYLNLSKTLILELDPKIPIGQQISLVKKMFLPKGQTIRDYVDSLEYVNFFSYLKDSMKIKEEKINKYFALKPIFMQSMLLMEYIEKPKTYETEIKDMAGKKKIFRPLETLDEQMSIFDSIPFEQQLSLSSDNYKIDKEYNKILHLYLNEDIKGIESMMKNDPDFKKNEYILLTKRNINWIPKIKESINNESSFIAVGCAHLFGENGLIHLLMKDGYTLTPIYLMNEVSK